MQSLNLNDLTAEHVKTFGQTVELTSEEHAEAMRLATAGLSAEDLDRPEMWDGATPMDELLNELREEQKRWDEQHSCD